MQRQENATLGNSLQEEIKPNRSPPSDSNPAHGLKSLKQMPNLAALPEVPPAFDFWGVSPVVVDPGHFVALIILAKVVSNPDESTLPGMLPPLWTATQVLQTRLLSSNDKAEQFAAMLSRGIVPLSSTEGGVEVIHGPDGSPVGFSLGDAYVQVVMTCVILTDGPSPAGPPDLFPFIASDCVDTYLLPITTDFVEFGRYLTVKNQEVRRGKHPPVISKNSFNNPRLVSQILTFGGAGVIIYSFTALLFRSPLLHSAPLVFYGAPIVLLFIVAFALALWKRNSRAGQLAASNYLRAMSWRAVDYAPEMVEEVSSRLSPPHAAQLSYEKNNQSSIPLLPRTDNQINDAREIKQDIIKIR